MLNEKISQRFQKLEDQLKNFDNSRAGNQYLTHVWLSWATSAQDLIQICIWRELVILYELCRVYG